jgi:hypothetical protein
MPVKKLLLAQYDMHHVLFNNVLDDISEEDASISLNGMKTIKWLAGHLLWDQGSFANICGVKLDFPWFGHFHSVEGAAPEDLAPAQNELPSLEMIKTNWNETVPCVRAGLDTLTKTQLGTVIDIPHPMFLFDNTVAGLWAFANHHQAYNIGQISNLRRGLGKKGMSYFFR